MKKKNCQLQISRYSSFNFFPADETYYHLKRCFLPGRGRLPALPTVSLTNHLLLQLKILQEEGNKSSKDVSCFTYHFKASLSLSLSLSLSSPPPSLSLPPLKIINLKFLIFQFVSSYFLKYILLLFHYQVVTENEKIDLSNI